MIPVAMCPPRVSNSKGFLSNTNPARSNVPKLAVMSLSTGGEKRCSTILFVTIQARRSEFESIFCFLSFCGTLSSFTDSVSERAVRVDGI